MDFCNCILHLIWEDGNPLPLGHLVQFANFAFAPIHLFKSEESLLEAKLQIEKGQSDCNRTSVCQDFFVEQLSFESDIILLRSRTLKTESKLQELFTKATSDMKVRIVLFNEGKNQTIIETVIIESHIVENYAYKALDKVISTRWVEVLFLNCSLPPGSSGAPAYCSESGKLIGFVHGNAEKNNWNTVCLSPFPMILGFEKKQMA